MFGWLNLQSHCNLKQIMITLQKNKTKIGNLAIWSTKTFTVYIRLLIISRCFCYFDVSF